MGKFVDALTEENLIQGVSLPSGEHLKLLLVDRINVDPDYQRRLSQMRIENIARNFDAGAVGIIRVGYNQKTGQHEAIDGKHRVCGMKLGREEGYEIPDRILCMVVPEVNNRIGGDLFVKLNDSKAVSGNDRFKAALIAKRKPETLIAKIIQDNGLELDFSVRGDSGHLKGVRGAAVLKRAFQSYPESFPLAVQILADVWKENYAARKGEVVSALSAMLNVQDGILNLPKVKLSLGEVDVYDAWKSADSLASHSTARMKRLANTFATAAKLKIPFPQYVD